MTAAPPRLRVAVVVCAYTLRRWDQLRAALTVAADQRPDQLVLVVDHELDLYRRARFDLAPVVPGLEVITNRRTPGLSGARNTGIEHVRADVVVFLDDDAVPEPGWLDALLEPYAAAEVVGVGGVAVPSWSGERAGRPAMLPATVTTANPEGRGDLDWVIGCSYAGQPTRPAPVRNLMGCSMSFRTAVFDRVGGFCEDLGRVGTVPLGCEETELCLRLTAADPSRVLLFAPGAVVRHHVGADRATWGYMWRRGYAEGVSKAAVSDRQGSAAGLATERTYVREVLPRALLHQVRSGQVRAATAVLTGLGATAVGYARGRLVAPRASAAPVLVAGASSLGG